MASKQLPAVLLAACAVLLALASDPDMLQDLCVADYKSLDGQCAALRLNGYPCKRPESTMANDFFSDVLSVPGNTGGNPSGSVVTTVTVDKVPGLNMLGVSMSRVDYAPWGVNPPHTHSRASELLFDLEGSLTSASSPAPASLSLAPSAKGKCLSSHAASSTFKGTTMVLPPPPYRPSTAASGHAEVD
ncbi:hypothetical protein VPH35_063326 [Triticum aestivum]|uniref:Germin-like protein 1-3 n=1 Tax=Aegilops tauschii TaxID=37682 RepID=M8BDZ3_AEGTA